MRSPSSRRTNSGFYNGLCNIEAIRPIWSASRYRRVDWIELGDSNEVQGGTGRNHGIQYALFTAGHPLYGTGMFSGNENAGSGSSIGYFCTTANDGGRPNDNANCPVDLDVYNKLVVGALSGPQFSTNYYWYMSDAQSTANNTGIVVSTGGPWNVNTDWRGWWRYGLPSTAGTGNFRPAIRRGDSPFTQLGIGTETATGGGDDTLVTQTIDLAAASRDYQLDFRWGPSGYTINGPIFLLWFKAEQTTVTKGWQLSTMIYRGGQGLFEFIQCTQASSDGMVEYFRCATEMQTGNKMALVCINSGLNDQNDAANLSLGPIGGLASDTAAGFADNTRGIMDACISNWVLAGNDKKNLYFLLWVSNPISLRDTTKLVAYRGAMELVSNQYANTAVVSTDVILNSYLQRNAADWYATGGTDTAHLTTTGYEQTSLLCIKAINQALGV